jgi:ATP-dependent helicase/nuclease subunit B
MKLLIGPSNSGKTSQVISRIAVALGERQSRPLLVVPSERAAVEMKSRLNESLTGKSIEQPKEFVSTFPTLYTAILNHTDHRVRWISAIERYRLLRNVVGELNEAGKLEYFDLIADKPGLISALGGFIDELWRSGTTPDDFALIARYGNAKDRDVAKIFAAYANELAADDDTESEGAGLLALKALEAAKKDSKPENATLPYTLVAADGFNFYTTVQVKLLSLLSALGVEVITTLTYEEGRAIHIWQEPTRARLAAAATDIVACASTPANLIDRAAIGFMRDDEVGSSIEISETKNSSADPNEAAINIISAPDRLTEVREAAREIKRLMRKDRFSVDEIAVICRSLHLYTAHFERVFDEWSIPLRCDRSSALGENPLIIAARKLLSLGVKNFPRRLCLDSLRSPYFDFSFAELDTNSIDALDRLSIKENVIRGCDQWREAIIATGERVKRRSEIDDNDEESAEERKARYSLMCERMDAFFQTLTFAPNHTRLDFVTAIKDCFDKLRVSQLLFGSEMYERDRVALETFLNLLTTLSESRHNRDGEVGWTDFLSEIDNAIAATTYVWTTYDEPVVVAQEIHNLRPRRYRAVFMLGMVEGEFPIRATERSPYTLFEREELRRAGIDLTETPADAGADLAQFYRAMGMATDRLFLSSPRTDLAGGELLPSYLIDEVRRVAPAREIRIAPAYSNSDRQLTKDIISLQELASATAARIRPTLMDTDENGLSLDSETEAAAAILDANLKSWPNTLRAAAVELSRLKGGADRFGGIIEDTSLLDLLNKKFGPDHMWNATQINDYGICPFRFFGRHVLGLGAMDPSGEGFVANQLGTAYHRILEDVYLTLSEKGIQITPDVIAAVREVAEQAGEAALERMVENRELRKSALWEFEKNEIKKRITKLLEKESDWNAEKPARPRHFERAFGKSGHEPLLIKDEAEEIKICGVIDRIDEREDGCVVIDYKTGRTPIHYNEALDGRNLQLPIYMMAAIRVVAPGARVAAAYYLHINSRKRGSELPHKDNPGLTVETMIEHAEKRIRDYAKSARKGRFPVSPNKGRCPNYCEFEVMCRIHSISSSSTEESGQS